jgi:hypothetical protein
VIGFANQRAHKVFAAPEAVYELDAKKGSQAPEQKNAPALTAQLALGDTEEQRNKSHNVYAENLKPAKNALMLAAQLALRGAWSTEDREQSSKSHHVYAAKTMAATRAEEYTYPGSAIGLLGHAEHRRRESLEIAPCLCRKHAANTMVATRAAECRCPRRAHAMCTQMC